MAGRSERGQALRRVRGLSRVSGTGTGIPRRGARVCGGTDRIDLLVRRVPRAFALSSSAERPRARRGVEAMADYDDLQKALERFVAALDPERRAEFTRLFKEVVRENQGAPQEKLLLAVAELFAAFGLRGDE